MASQQLATAGNQQPDHLAESAATLSMVPFFKGIPVDDLKALVIESFVKQYLTKDVVVRQGEFGHTMFVLLSGALDIYVKKANDSGEEETFLVGSLEQKGDFFGEFALLGRGTRSATVEVS